MNESDEDIRRKVKLACDLYAETLRLIDAAVVWEEVTADGSLGMAEEKELRTRAREVRRMRNEVEVMREAEKKG